ncbi:MAG: DUF1573 domain-containing protein [Flavobacterium sp.]
MKYLLPLIFIAFSCQEKAIDKIDQSSGDIDMNQFTQPQAVQNVETPVETTITKPADGKYPQIVFNKMEHDFGDITDGETVNYSFTVSNAGQADLVITNASASCGCTVPDYPKKPIKPGESGKIKVSFDSSNKPGMQQKSVTITSNTEKGSDVLTIKANVLPKKTEE